MECNSCFSLENVWFAYGKTDVLKDLSFRVPEGRITTFIGANGCGKTTLFNLMTKDLTPKKGRILLNGEDIADIRLRRFARLAAIVHQHNTAPPDLTVEKLVAYGRTPYHSFGQAMSEEDEQAVDRAMEITKVQKHRKRRVSELSGGQRQRVWIAMSVAQETGILFLDEPTTYLDIRYQTQILALIRKLNREYGVTVIMVLHDINQALYYSDEVLALSPGGEILAQGPPEQVITPPVIREAFGIEPELITAGEKKLILTF